MRKTIAAFFISLVLLLPWPVLVTAAQPQLPEHAGGRVLVKFRQGTPQNVVDLNVNKFNAKVSARIERLNVLSLNVPQGEEDIIASAFSKIPSVEFAEPDYVARTMTVTNDPSLSQQWGMFRVQAANASGASAWDVTSGNSTVNVAILDTGIDQDHEDLATKVVANQNFTTSPTVDDLYGHGTHVAGIAAAITGNGTGVAGLGYNSSLMNVKVLGDNASGYYSWIANGIIWATDNGAKVINMSLGGSSGSSTLANAVSYAASHGVVVVAAAGNSGNSSRTYPAYYSTVIAVAATDSNDARASWSSYGSWVDVAAPGVNIFSTFPNHPYQINKALGYDFGSGTSMATPHVVGLAALVWASGLCTTNTCVRAQIENNADAVAGTGTYWAHGRINAYRAVGGSSPVPSPTPTPFPSPTPTATPTPTPSPTPTPTSTPSPTPTPTPSPSPAPSTVMHVSNVSMWYSKLFWWRNVYTKVIVLDAGNNPVSSANVSLAVTLPSGTIATGSGKTATDGTVTFRVRSRETGTYKSDVTNVSKSAYTYDALSSQTTANLLVN